MRSFLAHCRLEKERDRKMFGNYKNGGGGVCGFATLIEGALFVPKFQEIPGHLFWDTWVGVGVRTLPPRSLLSSFFPPQAVERLRNPRIEGEGDGAAYVSPGAGQNPGFIRLVGYQNGNGNRYPNHTFHAKCSPFPTRKIKGGFFGRWCFDDCLFPRNRVSKAKIRVRGCFVFLKASFSISQSQELYVAFPGNSLLATN